MNLAYCLVFGSVRLKSLAHICGQLLKAKIQLLFWNDVDNHFEERILKLLINVYICKKISTNLSGNF